MQVYLYSNFVANQIKILFTLHSMALLSTVHTVRELPGWMCQSQCSQAPKQSGGKAASAARASQVFLARVHLACLCGKIRRLRIVLCVLLAFCDCRISVHEIQRGEWSRDARTV
jgi:hypothetical protein